MSTFLFRTLIVTTLIVALSSESAAQPETPAEVSVFLKELKRALTDHHYEKAFRRSDAIKSTATRDDVTFRLTHAALADRTGRKELSMRLLDEVVNETAESHDSSGAQRPRWQIYRLISYPLFMNEAADKGFAVTAVFLSDRALKTYDGNDSFQRAELFAELAAACTQNREYSRAIELYTRVLAMLESGPQSKKQTEFLSTQENALATVLSQTGKWKVAKDFRRRGFVNAMRRKNAYELLDSLHELVNCLVHLEGKRDDYDEIVEQFVAAARKDRKWVASVLDNSSYLSIEHCDAPLDDLSSQIKLELSGIRCRVNAEGS